MQVRLAFRSRIAGIFATTRTAVGPFAIVAALLPHLLCGCSSFNRDWRRAAQSAPPINSVEGRWEGEWRSDSNGHRGNLRCLMIPETNSMYQARFRATFAGVFHFGYTAQLQMEPHSDMGWEFNGEANLGKLGGTYYYEGRATATNLVSIYRSKYDRGTFEMHRP